ncbi:MAG: DUF2909 domain-containing protein [Methylococcales bacterium]
MTHSTPVIMLENYFTLIGRIKKLGDNAKTFHQHIITMIKTIILLLLTVILVSLGTALFHLVRKKDSPELMVKALTVRMGISLGLFVIIFIALATGLIQSHGIGR